MDTKVKMIPATQNFTAIDGKGISRNVKLEIYPKIIADVYVHYTGDYAPLYDDSVFITNVLKFFHENGYTGSDFDRAELGLQGENGSHKYIVLEPNDEFTKFATEKYGFRE